MALVGEALPRKEDLRLLTGEGRYTDNLFVPGMLFGVFVRSSFAHANLLGIDVSAARSASGVVAVFSGSEWADRLPLVPCGASDDPPPRRPLTGDRARYVGEPVALILARTRGEALDAAELVAVDYEALPAVFDPWEALKPGAPLVHPDRHTNKVGEIRRVVGDPDRAFAEADRVIARRLTVQRIAASALEPRAILAQPEQVGGGLTVWLSNQSPHSLRTWLSEIFGIAESRIRVVAQDVGGGFGSKLDLYSDELAVIWAALRLGAPVKWTETRSENLTSTVHARDQIHETELAVRADGRIVALRSHFVGDLGAHFHFFTPVVPDLTVDTLTGNYDIATVDIHLERVFTNKMSIEALRGSGRAEATYVLERMIEETAQELGIDPLEMRLRNLIRPGQLPYTTQSNQTYDGGDYPGMLRRAADLVGYEEFRSEQSRARSGGRYLGVGLATYNLICGFSPSGHDWNPFRFFPGHETALIRVDPHGKVALYSGLCPQGQGSDTALAQVVGDELGVAYDSISVTHGDTALLPYGGGTHGSRGAIVGAHAALMAAKRVREKASLIAAEMLEAAPEDVDLSEERFVIRGTPDRSVSWLDVCHEAHFLKKAPGKFEPGLEATAFYDPPDVGYSFGANAAVVEVDIETGRVELLRFVSVDDCGRVLNPNIVAGQIHGGIAQGIGQALYEEVVHDETGQVMSSNFTTYLLPSPAEVPNLELERWETPSDTLLGVRGVGESGTLASTPAVVNAVADALAPFGIRLERTPLRPDVIWELLHPEDAA